MNESFIGAAPQPLRVLRNDAIVAGLVLLLMLLISMLLLNTPARGAIGPMLIVQALMLVLRRAAPITFAMLAAVNAGASVSSNAYGIEVLTVGVIVLISIYSVAAFAQRRWRFLGLLSLPAAIVTIIGTGYYGWFLPPMTTATGEPIATPPEVLEPELGSLLISAGMVCALYLAAFALGLAKRGQLDLVGRERERANLLERDAHRLAELAVADERTRIAREMHDIIAHSLASIVTLSEGGRMAARNDAELSAELFAKISESGRDALGEVKRLLRNVADTQDDEPARGVADIRALVDRIALAGQPLTMHEFGVARTLPAGISLAVYRVAQESLTNVLKHAPGSRAELHLDWQGDHLDLEVTNVAEGAGSVSAPDGRGMAGMRERTELFDGTFAVDRVAGLFRVRASWPISAETPAAPSIDRADHSTSEGQITP